MATAARRHAPPQIRVWLELEHQHQVVGLIEAPRHTQRDHHNTPRFWLLLDGQARQLRTNSLGVVDEFETTDPAMRGVISVTFTLTEADGGTDVLAVHDNLPPGVAPADNESGWRMALEKLARLIEADQQS